MVGQTAAGDRADQAEVKGAEDAVNGDVVKKAEAAVNEDETRKAEATVDGEALAPVDKDEATVNGGSKAEAAVNEDEAQKVEATANGDEAVNKEADKEAALEAAQEAAILLTRPTLASSKKAEAEDADVPAEQEKLLSSKNGGAKKVEQFELEEKFDFWGLTLREKMRYIRNNITVEPMLAMYTIPSVLASLATQNLNLEKACRVNLGYDDVVCDALTARMTTNYTLEEAEVQKLTASMAGWKTFIQSSLPAVLILFVGSWSDRHGRRKPCMLLPIIGELLTSIGLLVCTYFYYELPIEAATFAEAVFPAMTGGWFVMFMAVFTYIADVTTEADRTFRIGVVNVFFSIGIPIGMALSGVAHRLIGFYGVFSLSTCMYVCSFWWGYTQVKEEPKKWSGDGPAPHGVIGFLKDFFDVRYLLETMRTCFKKGENNRRIKVILLMVVVMLVIGPLHGENTVMYLFVRLRFNWDELDFSLFSTYSVISNLVGTMLSVGLFSSLLKYDDSVIGMMSCASKILAGFIYAFATTVSVLLIAPLVDMMNGTSFIAMRAMASKLVPSDELGKVNSLFGACEAMMPVVCGPLYSKVYQLTMQDLPGGFFLVGGVITFPAFLIFGWYYYEARKDRKRKAAIQTTQKVP
ncbi:proton-coupled folate transporter-like isoform X2 [Thrips palmi]|uniref:Proton-coupled folate transporter-like isoform X2 n=1 Tax=Thrips palmi TaxID=161013 RepID=A0A6P8ZMY9_THRPL|nr:proton-coupled folate transporter-like isoform X2 [Thrips palmi]